VGTSITGCGELAGWHCGMSDLVISGCHRDRATVRPSAYLQSRNIPSVLRSREDAFASAWGHARFLHRCGAVGGRARKPKPDEVPGPQTPSRVKAQLSTARATSRPKLDNLLILQSKEAAVPFAPHCMVLLVWSQAPHVMVTTAGPTIIFLRDYRNPLFECWICLVRPWGAASFRGLG
jgi:hypothetical protein